MRDNARDRDIIHAGMFFGDFLPGLSSAMAVGRTIYGFEPNAENFACAQWTLILNNITNVAAYNFGLGANTGTAEMRVRDNGIARGGASSIIRGSQGNVPSDDIESVKITSIDNIVPRDANVGILQLDVEGHEGPAIRGAMQTIKRCLPILIVETVPEMVFSELLFGIGYRNAGTVCDNTIFKPS